MKKILLYFCTLSLALSNVSAQKSYDYLKGQSSPFNGVFNEPRYVDVDSISYSKYTIGVLTYADEDNQPMQSAYTLIEQSPDKSVDTLKTFDTNNGDLLTTSVKEYSENGKLLKDSTTNNHRDIYVGTYIEVNKYLYDSDGRISKIITYKSNAGALDVIVNDTVEYDYTFKQYSPELEYNTICRKEYSSSHTLDSIYVFYTDSGYMTWQNFPSYGIDTIQYVFDSQNRLIKILPSMTVFDDGTNTAYCLKAPEPVEYRYTDSGYEMYIGDTKHAMYVFQSDGYCTEIIQYQISTAQVYPPIYYIVERYTYSYFKNGNPIVANESVAAQAAPKAYGVQGGIAVNTEKAQTVVCIYAFSGSMIKQQTVSAGNTTVPLPKGLYVVVIGNMSYKVAVR